MTTFFHRDYESRSAAELKDVGVFVYAEHPTTDVWCMAYAVDDGPVNLWVRGQPCPPEYLECARNPDWLAVAHNDQFEACVEEFIMAKRYGWPIIPAERHRCTMALAYSHSLPGSLEQAAAAVGLPFQKDMAGHRIMLQMARPRRIEPDGTIVWWDDDPARVERLHTYCRGDIPPERELLKRLRVLSPVEQRIWHLDQTINKRGVAIDKTLCHRAQRVVERATVKLDAKLKKTTDGAVSAVSNVQQLAAWVRKRAGQHRATVDAVEDMAETPPAERNYGWADAKLASMSKDAIVDLLEEWDLPEDVETALLLRQEGGKTSTAKIQKFLDWACTDGRVRGMLQYHGAGTGRWAGRGPQPQNLSRPKIKNHEIAEAIDLIMGGQDDLLEMLYGGVPSTVSDCIRGMIVPGPGRKLYSADFANIEGRVLAWWAGEAWKLRAFETYDAGKGPDLYKVAASGIFGVPIEKVDGDKRQIGKVSELALGYQGGVGAFVAMAKTYGLKIERYVDIILAACQTEHQERAEETYANLKRKPAREVYVPAEIVKLAWRDTHPATVQLWRKCEDAVLAAVATPGSIHAVNGVRWRVNGSFLWCQLPGGRLICYPYPRIVPKEMPWGEVKDAVTYKGVDSRTRKWGDQYLYGGKIVENVVQAIARDVMAEAMVRVENAGYEVVMTVHDEVVAERQDIAEVYGGHGNVLEVPCGSIEEFKTLMATLPVWAKANRAGDALPVSVEGWSGARYRK